MPLVLGACAGLVARYPHHVGPVRLGDGPVMPVGCNGVVLYQKSGDFFGFVYLFSIS